MEEVKELDDVKPVKIEETELAQIQSSIQTVERLTNEVGGIEVRKHALMKAMESVHVRIEALRVKLEGKYGTDNIDLKDGTITYSEEN